MSEALRVPQTLGVFPAQHPPPAGTPWIRSAPRGNSTRETGAGQPRMLPHKRRSDSTDCCAAVLPFLHPLPVPLPPAEASRPSRGASDAGTVTCFLSHDPLGTLSFSSRWQFEDSTRVGWPDWFGACELSGAPSRPLHAAHPGTPCGQRAGAGTPRRGADAASWAPSPAEWALLNLRVQRGARQSALGAILGRPERQCLQSQEDPPGQAVSAPRVTSPVGLPFPSSASKKETTLP